MTTALANHPRELLLVEDSFGDAMLAEEAFATARSPIRLSIAGDGEEALSRMRQQRPFHDQPRPELVLLDLNLPRMDGRAVLREVRSDPQLRPLPIIVMTGSNADVDIRDSYALGANGYIVKPMHFEALEEVVAAIEQFWFGVAALPASFPSSRSNAA